MAGDIDAAIERELAQDFSLAGAGEGVLVVDAAMRGLDDDLAGRKIVQRNRFDAGTLSASVVVNAESVEGLGRIHRD